MATEPRWAGHGSPLRSRGGPPCLQGKDESRRGEAPWRFRRAGASAIIREGPCGVSGCRIHYERPFLDARHVFPSGAHPLRRLIRCAKTRGGRPTPLMPISFFMEDGQRPSRKGESSTIRKAMLAGNGPGDNYLAPFRCAPRKLQTAAPHPYRASNPEFIYPRFRLAASGGNLPLCRANRTNFDIWRNLSSLPGAPCSGEGEEKPTGHLENWGPEVSKKEASSTSPPAKALAA